MTTAERLFETEFIVETPIGRIRRRGALDFDVLDVECFRTDDSGEGTRVITPGGWYHVAADVDAFREAYTAFLAASL